MKEAQRRRQLQPHFLSLFSNPDRFIRVAEDAYGRQIAWDYVDGEDHKVPAHVRPCNLYHLFIAMSRRGMIQEVRSATRSPEAYGISVDHVYYRPILDTNSEEKAS